MFFNVVIISKLPTFVNQFVLKKKNAAPNLPFQCISCISIPLLGKKRCFEKLLNSDLLLETVLIFAGDYEILFLKIRMYYSF